MTSGNDYFELQADNNSELIAALKRHADFEKAEEIEGKILFYTKVPVESSTLNRYLFENNISLNHLVKRKSSLEEQFLALTK